MFLQPAGQDTRTVALQNTGENQIDIIYNLSQNPLRPFAETQYWFKLDYADGQSYTSPHFQFIYEDNRFTWQRLEQDGVQVAWIDGDLDFGQQLINTTLSSLGLTQTFLPVTPPSPLKIYVYPSSQDLQSAFQITNSPWAGAHASPDLGVMLLSIQPGPDQLTEMQRLIPHELTHILQYQYTGPSYTQMPTWLLEGMASAAELYPNDEYQSALEDAKTNGSLLSMVSLCAPFPKDLSSSHTCVCSIGVLRPLFTKRIRQ